MKYALTFLSPLLFFTSLYSQDMQDPVSEGSLLPGNAPSQIEKRASKPTYLEDIYSYHRPMLEELLEPLRNHGITNITLDPGRPVFPKDVVMVLHQVSKVLEGHLAEHTEIVKKQRELEKGLVWLEAENKSLTQANAALQSAGSRLEEKRKKIKIETNPVDLKSPLIIDPDWIEVGSAEDIIIR